MALLPVLANGNAKHPTKQNLQCREDQAFRMFFLREGLQATLWDCETKVIVRVRKILDPQRIPREAALLRQKVLALMKIADPERSARGIIEVELDLGSTENTPQ